MPSKSSTSELLQDYYGNALLLLVFKDMLDEILNRPSHMEDSSTLTETEEPSAKSVPIPSYLQG